MFSDDVGLFRFFQERGIERIVLHGGGADLAGVLIAAHDVAEGEKDGGKNEHEHEQADYVTAAQHAFLRASSSS